MLSILVAVAMVLFKMGNSKMSFDKPDVPNDFFKNYAKDNPLKDKTYFALISGCSLFQNLVLFLMHIDYSRFWIRTNFVTQSLKKKMLLVAIKQFTDVDL